jgi:hypothetical protein
MASRDRCATIWTGLIVALCAAAPGAHAQTADPRAWMGRDEIIAAFVGQQLAGIYPSKVPWREHVRPDGTTTYREGSAQREGRWWMRGDHFCFSYALPQSGGCFQVVAVGRNCYELYAIGRGGGAEPPPSNAQRHWNGRMWREDIPATCEEKPIV